MPGICCQMRASVFIPAYDVEWRQGQTMSETRQPWSSSMVVPSSPVSRCEKSQRRRRQPPTVPWGGTKGSGVIVWRRRAALPLIHLALTGHILLFTDHKLDAVAATLRGNILQPHCYLVYT